MTFDLHDDLFANAGLSKGVTLRVVYYSAPSWQGSTWQLKYDNGGPDLAPAMTVTNSGSGNWIKEDTEVFDAVFNNGGPNGTDFSLDNTDRMNDIFHMIEVEREGAPTF